MCTNVTAFQIPHGSSVLDSHRQTEGWYWTDGQFWMVKACLHLLYATCYGKDVEVEGRNYIYVYKYMCLCVCVCTYMVILQSYLYIHKHIELPMCTNMTAAFDHIKLCYISNLHTRFVL